MRALYLKSHVDCTCLHEGEAGTNIGFSNNKYCPRFPTADTVT